MYKWEVVWMLKMQGGICLFKIQKVYKVSRY